MVGDGKIFVFCSGYKCLTGNGTTDRDEAIESFLSSLVVYAGTWWKRAKRGVWQLLLLVTHCVSFYFLSHTENDVCHSAAAHATSPACQSCYIYMNCHLRSVYLAFLTHANLHTRIVVLVPGRSWGSYLWRRKPRQRFWTERWVFV
jgi:hypothetical protein